ncbi:MAG: indolepyruvate oxidoreductase subunit beta [Candidatus Thorarchaeota archaeon]|jgi:indolepyruvate ferredoxin oxidoreductase beta subunit
MNSINSNTEDITNVVIAGVGGQGVLTLAEILAKAALADSHNVRVGEIHGMAQRGGHVVCTVRVGEKVRGPIVDSGTAHLVIGFEPVETLREVHLVRSDGYVIMNTHVQFPVSVSMGKAEYPNHESIITGIRKFTNNILELDAMNLAVEAGSSRSLNMVILGTIIGTDITPISQQSAITTVRNAFPSKFETVNIAAFNLGLNAIKNQLKK